MTWTTGLAVAVLLAFAGCIGSPDDGAARDDTVPDSPSVVEGTGMIVASGPVLAVGGDSMPFNVTGNVTVLYAEIVWEDEVQDIDLALASPSAGMTGTAQNFDHVAQAGSPGMPDSPHSLTVIAPEPGAWLASAFANGAATMVEYRIVVTLFHGEVAVPDGYTAL
jgi:hypothetical protein